ncbi:MAG: hypothetical protein R3E95_18125 [Thiolinea sp.]
MENRLYQDDIIYAEDTGYQRIMLARRQQRLRFYINGALQFDSYDEYRYHTALVHPAAGLIARPEHVLVLGGGDGLALRELPSIRPSSTLPGRSGPGRHRIVCCPAYPTTPAQQ